MSSIEIQMIFGVLQVTVLAVAALAALRSAKINRRNFDALRQTQARDFFLSTEARINPVRHNLVGADPALIREVYKDYDVDKLSDIECRTFPFMQAVYSHVSTIYYILEHKQLDLGLNDEDRKEILDAWKRYIIGFKNHPAMMRMHTDATKKRRDFNSSFMEMAEEELQLERDLREAPIATLWILAALWKWRRTSSD